MSGIPAGSANAIFANKHEGVRISYPGHGLFDAVGRRVVESVPWPWLKLRQAPRLSVVVPDPVHGGLWLGFVDRGISYFENGQIIKTIDTKDGLGADLVWNLLVDHQGHFGPQPMEA